MPIFDQFETEAYTGYSGSYTDRVQYGNSYFYNEFTLTNVNPYGTNRKTIALKTTGLDESYFSQVDISRADWFEYVSAAYLPSKTQNGNLKLFSINEVIYNSLVPSPIDIIKNNNQITPYLNTTSSWKQIFSSSLNVSTNLERTSLQETSAHVFLTAQGTNIPSPDILNNNTLTVPINSFSNVDWLYQYPFQSKFKKIESYLGAGLNNVDITTDIYSSSFYSPPFQTNKLGSLFYAHGDGTFKRYVQYSQMWLGAGAKVSLPSKIAHKHIYTKSYNPLQKIYMSNYSGSQNPAYIAFGENGTILTSSNGLSHTWKTISSIHETSSVISSNPFNLPMEIDNWPPALYNEGQGIIPIYTATTGSIRDALPIAYNSALIGTDGSHLQWLLIVEAIDSNGNRRGKLVRTKSSRWGNKIPSKDDWELVNLDQEFNMGAGATTPIDIDLYSFATKNPAGENITSTIQQIFVVGKVDSYDEFGTSRTTTALIGVGGNDGASAYASCASNTFTKNSAGQADRLDTIWFSTTCGKWNDRTGTFPYSWVCGLDCSTVSPTGSGYIARSFASNGSATADTYTQVNLGNIWSSAVDVPALYSIAYSHISGALGLGSNRTVLCVGARGTILKNTNGGVSSGNWVKKTPDNSYVGTFVDVKKIYSLNSSQGLEAYDWVIVGDDGEIQISDDDGNTWISLTNNGGGIDYPNRISGSSGLGNTIYNSQTYGSGSKNVVYTETNRNNSFRSYYAGSIEKKLITNVANIATPPFTMAVGGVTTHDFNEKQFDPPTTIPAVSYDTVLICRLADVSGTNSGYKNDFIDQYKFETYTTFNNNNNTFIKPSNSDYYKSFFGYGDGFSLDLTDYQYGNILNVGRKGKTPNFLDWSPYDLYGHVDVPQFNLYGPQIRGWKYGLYSAINTPSSAVWRRGKYGQFRDMLEQRIFTKYIQIEQTDPYSYPTKTLRRTVDGPINIVFVSGSTIFADTIDYVTATNPSYNPYDSGIYDIEYRSGQPFFDR